MDTYNQVAFWTSITQLYVSYEPLDSGCIVLYETHQTRTIHFRQFRNTVEQSSVLAIPWDRLKKHWNIAMHIWTPCKLLDTYCTFWCDPRQTLQLMINTYGRLLNVLEKCKNMGQARATDWKKTMHIWNTCKLNCTLCTVQWCLHQTVQLHMNWFLRPLNSLVRRTPNCATHIK